MNEIDQWLEDNNDYLAKVLTWLRLLLRQRLAQDQPPAPQVKENKYNWISGIYKSGEAASQHAISDAEIASAEKAVLEAETVPHPPAAVILSRSLGLSRFEQNLLLLCAAMELDPQMADLCCRAQRETEHRYPTFALAFNLFAKPDWNALAPSSPLRYWRLLDIHQPGPQPLTVAPCIWMNAS